MTDTNESPDEPIGRALRRLRRAKGLTQAAAGEAVGVTQQAYSAWESGTVPPSESLQALERLLGRPAGSLVRIAYGPMDDDTQARLEALDERVSWIEDWIQGRD